MDADAFECNGPEAKTLCTALFQAVDQGASDLHVVAGHRPTVRLNGRLQELPGNVLNEACVRAGLLDLCPECSREQFARDRNVDFALDINLKGRSQRFRANYFLSGHTPGACFRIIPSAIPDLGWANFPADLAVRLTNFRNGLVLVTGISGAGKTTTLAMLINLLLSEGNYRIITVEEPIEYNFPSRGNSIVTQREVGRDVATFADGLKYGLRQDPDVILVGEIRDRDTAQMTLSAAETGHFVFATLHTRDAKGAISRFADLFPQQVQGEIRAQLAMGLRAVVCQHLLPSTTGTKRELALEILFNNSPIASAIRTGKDESIDRNILTSRAEGMIPLDESVRRLFQAGKISQETAEQFVSDKSALAR
ncbi:MAG TPA: PilT/PilU family type 4a pilus ATPase [Planctomycetaceae bacterium]|jgi:twitching motility protein PilT|nr:PilT/PilU family type 4a pilus ATPase [Planctomycetaceae bacterium]